MRLACWTGIALALLSPFSVFGQAPDPGGWTLARWGMTADEVKQVLPAVTITPTGAEISGYEISRRKFSVLFSFDQGGRLRGVRFRDLS